VGLFKLVSEAGVSAGVRRITALTGGKALEHVRRNESALAEVAGALKVPPAVVPGRIADLLKELRDLRKQLEAKPKEGGVTADKLLDEAFEVSGARVVVAEIPGGTAPSLRQQIDQLRQKAPNVAVMLGSRQEDKVLLVAGVSRDLQQKGLDSVRWIRSAAEIVGGSGGGKPDMAQAGGKHPDKLPAALDEARESIRKLMLSV
jgi:alanyl-tRNA synthetase